LPEFDGIGFSVGARVDGARGCFEEPRDVRDWLEALARKPDSLGVPATGKYWLTG
jgi:hypothetical protein